MRKSCRLRWKHLSTGSHRGDLQKGNVYASWCQSPSTRAQKCRFCARKARKWGFRSRKAHKNLDFVLERPENGGSGGQKRTKTSILCSKSPKTRVPNPKKAQKPRFCARKARKQGFQTQIKHKKPDFVLGKKEIGIGKHNLREAYRKRGLPVQIIAHANVPWSCLEEGFVCAMNCRNGTPSQVAVVSGTQHLHTGQATALSPILQLRTGQAAASFGGDAEVA